MRLTLGVAAVCLAAGALWTPQGALAARSNGAADALIASLSQANSIKTASGPVSGRPTDRASARAAVLAGNFTSKLHHERRDRRTNPCPAACNGADPGSWDVYHDANLLKECNQTMLLDFALFNHVDDSKPVVKISACTADLKANGNRLHTLSMTNDCAVEGVKLASKTTQIQLGSSGASSKSHVADVSAALDQLLALSSISSPNCQETIKYATSGDVIVGVYAGSGVASQGVLASVVQKLNSEIQSSGQVAEDLVAQVCGSKTPARYTLGIFATTKGHLGAVQRSVQSWKNGTCVSTSSMGNANVKSSWNSVTYLAPSSSHSNSTSISSSGKPKKPLLARADCRTIQVEAGDSCESLATECGITPAQFTQYNPSSSLCGALTPGQHVCCSSGTLPDFTPKPDDKGNCYSYLVKDGDSCASIGAAYDLTNAQIESFNKKTWGWNGCAKLFASYKICLSTGYPPMPAPVANAVCGPQVNGTTPAPPGVDVSTLNECPLNACCNIWGQCGTTGDFCTPSNSSTGAPGTAAPNENGCISNCGDEILTSDPPSETMSIAYFEAFDQKRKCLKMPVTAVDTSAYTHIHFSFITLNEDYSINVDGVESQLRLLSGMAGVKRIVSVGGWDFSTSPSTYQIFRKAVSSEDNRQTLVNNIVDFLAEYDLDGVDWDWEYPDEPDIPGIPKGTEDETTGYFLLLDELKLKLPSNRTVSITAPASFWYLQYFPILALSFVVDYIVYMTYDLHGQWDYINKYASPGCPSYDQGLGNCLRSHVNLTETLNALSMITKAGVPSNMITVGVSSYGRSFQMSSAGCWTEQCTYTGPDSGATPGPCTNTSGYISNYEINRIVAGNPSAEVHWDQDSYSNIVVYNGTQWVAFMNDSNKATRTALYPSINFLGIADWAVDLLSEDGDTSDPSSSSEETIYIDPGIWSSATPSIVAPPGASLIWPPKPLSSATTITFPPWTTTVSYSSLTTGTSTLTDGSTTTYHAYVWVSWLTTLTIPAVTTTEIGIWGVSLDKSSSSGTIYLTSSVQPPPFKVTITPVVSGTTSIIGPTKTSTIIGTVITYGSETWTEQDETQTQGRSTSIKGGTTLPPTVITVTPNPHPTTVATKPDPEVNPKPPPWKSGSDPKPTAKPGCSGCGKPCILFCDSGCPFCPPGIFHPGGGGGRGGGDPNDPDDGDDDDDDDDPSQYTMYAETVLDDEFPDSAEDAGSLNALWTTEISRFASEMGWLTTSSTTTKPSSTPPPPPPPKPTPEATCEYFYGGVLYEFFIYYISGWDTDDLEGHLHDEENGCGALTGWDWDYANAKDPSVAFNLPLFIKDGCVERAIVSAGGPKISCSMYGGWGTPGPDDDDMDAAFKKAHQANVTQEHGPYRPMNWATLLARATGRGQQ
ncbi:glycoside hydrolase family 18 protein [Trichoderma longibrachiatum ATCC 18648]|uniref:chitinase n=1 Tax=Trichoderma longibrachiatum ATCC 18648 TaxID=983965 RepID=A0A2T4CDE9_TRILO|nr:glycoside hydrolase family 18 protein [Trichoderma longibrachiatum ATCC 18648]